MAGMNDGCGSFGNRCKSGVKRGTRSCVWSGFGLLGMLALALQGGYGGDAQGTFIEGVRSAAAQELLGGFSGTVDDSRRITAAFNVTLPECGDD